MQADSQVHRVKLGSNELVLSSLRVLTGITHSMMKCMRVMILVPLELAAQPLWTFTDSDALLQFVLVQLTRGRERANDLITSIQLFEERHETTAGPFAISTSSGTRLAPPDDGAFCRRSR